MNMLFAVYGVFLLIVRWVFYIVPEKKHLAFYILKLVIEIGVFLLLYQAAAEIKFAVSGLIVLINMFCYVIETKIFQRNDRKQQHIELLAGFVIYAVAFTLVFRSGNINGFTDTVSQWAAGRRIISNPRFFYISAFGLVAVSETEHIARFLRARFTDTVTQTSSLNGVYQTAGYAERAAIFVLVFFSHFIAAAIIIAGRLVSAGWSENRLTDTALTALSLAWALVLSLALRLIF